MSTLFYNLKRLNCEKVPFGADRKRDDIWKLYKEGFYVFKFFYRCSLAHKIVDKSVFCFIFLTFTCVACLFAAEAKYGTSQFISIFYSRCQSEHIPRSIVQKYCSFSLFSSLSKSLNRMAC